MGKRPPGRWAPAEAWVGSEGLDLGRAVEGAMVVEQEPITVDRVEQCHGLLDDAIGELVTGQSVVTEFVFDGGMGGAQGDDGDFGGVREQVEATSVAPEGHRALRRRCFTLPYRNPALPGSLWKT